MRLAEQRRCEISAEAAAARRHAFTIDPRLRAEPIGGLDGVLIRKRHPFLGDGIRPRLAEAARAVEVVPGGHVTPAGENLRVPTPLICVPHGVVRTAVKY